MAGALEALWPPQAAPVCVPFALEVLFVPAPVSRANAPTGIQKHALSEMRIAFKAKELDRATDTCARRFSDGRGQRAAPRPCRAHRVFSKVVQQ